MDGYLGIDWGLQKIGIAFADGESRMAFAHGTVTNDKEAFQNIIALADEYACATFVVGKSEHHTLSDNTALIDAFVENLQKHSDLPVIFAEEMFSTHEAQQNLKQAGHKNLASKDDAESARIILQYYLDQNLGA